MRAALAALVLLLAGCGTPGVRGDAASTTQDAALSLDLFPFDARSATFVDSRDAAPRTLRVEPSPDGASARVLLDVAGAATGEMRVTRRDGSLFFSADVGPGTELIRAGAKPGDGWESEGGRVRFEGWERVTPPSASYDAARITVRRGRPELEVVETWWFARGVGLVRQRTDRGSLMTSDRVRSSP